MNKGHLYRLQQIHEIEKQLHEEKLKHSAIIKKYHCLLSFCTACFLNVRFLSNFQEIIGHISSMILQGFNLLFGSVSIFLKVIEKLLFKKIQNR